MDFETNTIFKKLVDIRQDLDMTQKNMSEQIGVKQGVYSRWENGKEIIPLRRLIKFCNITSYRMDYITDLTRTEKRNPVNMEVDSKVCGERLKKWRKENKITQKELATFLNTTQSTISAYESGEVLILTAFLYQIAKKYKISMDWICGRIEEEKIK